VTTEAERFDDERIARRRESLDEQVRRRGLRPVNSLDDVARDDVRDGRGARRLPRLGLRRTPVESDVAGRGLRGPRH
jgi:hypothetical protein